MHVKQVRLVHGVNRQWRRHAAALAATLAVAAHVGEGATAGSAAGLVVEVVVVGDLGRIFAVCQGGSLEMYDLTVELLLAPLELLELLEALSGCVVDYYFLVLELLALA